MVRDGLNAGGTRPLILDGDDIRSTLNADLGFSPHDRRENLRRAAHICRLFNSHGVPVLATFVSPLAEYRQMAREIIGDFTLVYVKCGIAACEARDVKGMYKKARGGLIRDFTGVSAPFEEPLDAQVTVDTEHSGIEECAAAVLKAIGIVNGR
jgi:adenylylsulfate kinase